jgi:high affinity Mn2+ porin
VRVLAYRNRERMGRFDDAVAAFRADPGKNAAACGCIYGSMNANAPDLGWVRKPNVKMGIGINVEQEIAPDIGLFFRGMFSDGNTEVYAFTSTDRSVSFGALGKGSVWHRPDDVAGLGVGLGWISASHADYLRLGGVDGFIGDGNIDPAVEGVFEAFYSASVITSVWLSADFQHIVNPAFNADRGPVEVLGARVHAEF